MKLRIACLVLVMAVAGCGDSNQTFTRTYIEETATQGIRENVEAKGGTMDSLECVMDGDEFHWRCIADARVGDQVIALTVAVTCDAETGTCISRSD